MNTFVIGHSCSGRDRRTVGVFGVRKKIHRVVVSMLQFVAMLILTVSTVGCSRNDSAGKAFEQQLEKCREQFLANPLVPIVGGGYLDTRRFAFNVPTVRYEDGKCGTDGFVTSFYWTGEKILPADKRFTGFDVANHPKHWRALNVAAMLGNQRKAHECREQPDQCKSSLSPLPAIWPEKLTVHLRNYPLDVRLPEIKKDYATHEIRFELRGWPRSDKQPRFITCDINRNTSILSREEIEQLDFGVRTLPCQADFRDFDFKYGAARVSTSTDALHDITPALQALQKYISDSIVTEQ